MGLHSLARFINDWIAGELPERAERTWRDEAALRRFAARHGYVISSEDLRRRWDDLQPLVDTLDTYWEDLEDLGDDDNAPVRLPRNEGAAGQALTIAETDALLRGLVRDEDPRLRFGTSETVWQAIQRCCDALRRE